MHIACPKFNFASATKLNLGLAKGRSPIFPADPLAGGWNAKEDLLNRIFRTYYVLSVENSENSFDEKEMTVSLKLLFLIFMLKFGFAQTDTCESIDVKQHNVSEQGLIIKGYDPVSYFPEHGGKPQIGNEDIRVRYCGILFYFSSEAHRKTFLGNPLRFLPDYGAWNPHAMAHFSMTEIDPLVFNIDEISGRLNLFVSEASKNFYLRHPQLQEDAKKNWDRYVLN